MMRPPWREPDWDALEERVDVTLVIDLASLREWALSLCPWADAPLSAWKGAALMGFTLQESWGEGLDVEFRLWAGDTVVELCYPTGDRDLSADEEEMLDDVRARTSSAVYARLESGLWVVAKVACFGIFQTLSGMPDTCMLHGAEATEEAARERLGEAIDRLRSLGLRPEHYDWTVEPMPTAAKGGSR